MTTPFCGQLSGEYHLHTDSKPRLDESTGMYRYYDEEGREVHINKDDITQIMER
ncbi:YgdI/YgdR family lipoprotein [Aeromonas caviae]